MVEVGPQEANCTIRHLYYMAAFPCERRRILLSEHTVLWPAV